MLWFVGLVVWLSVGECGWVCGFGFMVVSLCFWWCGCKWEDSGPDSTPRRRVYQSKWHTYFDGRGRVWNLEEPYMCRHTHILTTYFDDRGLRADPERVGVVELHRGHHGDGAVPVQVGEGEGELQLGERDVGVPVCFFV